MTVIASSWPGWQTSRSSMRAIWPVISGPSCMTLRSVPDRIDATQRARSTGRLRSACGLRAPASRPNAATPSSADHGLGSFPPGELIAEDDLPAIRTVPPTGIRKGLDLGFAHLWLALPEGLG